MPRTRSMVAVGAAIFLVGLLASFPARVAYRWCVPGYVLLGGMSGTTWRGTAAEARLDGLYLRDFAWRFRPLALLTARARSSLSARSPAGPVSGDVAVGFGGVVHVSGLRARLPLAALSDLATFAGVDGLLDADVSSLTLDDGLPVRAEGSLEVSRLVARQLAPVPLGTYRAELTTVDDVLRAEIRDVAGALDLEGTFEIRPDRTYLLAGRVAAAPGAPEGVARQLAFLGSPDADGMRPFRFEGRL